MAERYININYPFRDSENGFFVDMTQTSKDAVKSDLLHLLVTDKGKRYYMPEFGTNLKKYIFEPNDAVTHNDIMGEIQVAVNTYIPGLLIDSMTTSIDPSNENMAVVRVDFTIGQGVFAENDFIQFAIVQ